MKAKAIALTIIAAAILMIGYGASAQCNGFTINNADATNCLDTAGSSTINQLIGDVGPRFFINRANDKNVLPVMALPGELGTLIGQIGDRFYLQSANAKHILSVGYPGVLIDDREPPVISNVSLGAGNIFSWLTDEYTTGELRYGTQPGVYPQVYTDTLFSLLHQFTLPDITTGTRYYYIIKSTDRNGNVVETNEGSFSASSSIFIPLIRKK